MKGLDLRLIALPYLLLVPVLVLPLALQLTVVGSVALGVVVTLIAAALALLEDARGRAIFLALFGWAFLVHASALLAIAAIQQQATGGFVLGPDSATYWAVSNRLSGDLGLYPSPVAGNALGTFDVAHYYIFAVVLRGFGGDVFTLQVLNSAFMSLVAPLMFSWTRIAAPRVAVPVGVILAAYPSLIALSAVGLLKDASVSFFTVMVIWGLTRAITANHVRSSLVPAALAIVGFWFVRTERSYLPALLEVAMLATAVVVLLRFTGVSHSMRLWPAAIVIVLLGEIGPALVGWPFGPALLAQEAGHALVSMSLQQAPPGLVDELSHVAPASPSATSSSSAPRIATVVPLRSATPVSPTAVTPGSTAPFSPTAAPQRSAVPVSPTAMRSVELTPSLRAVPTAAPTPGPSAGATSSPLVRGLVNLFRKFFGPYPWVPPSEYSSREIFGGDYLLYPGMLAWYGLLPFIGVGLASTFWRSVRSGGQAPALLGLGFFASLSTVLYAGLNFSYRQREDLVPFLIVFGLLGVVSRPRSAAFRLMYLAYWIGLAVIAAAHTVLRSIL